MNKIIDIKDVHKTFGAVEALRGVSFSVEAGSIHAICGENGAGKTTLIKILAGVEQADRGTYSLAGVPKVFSSPIDALNAGIATIYQNLALADDLSIYENVFMGAELTRRVAGVPVLNKKAMRAASLDYMSRLTRTLDNMNDKVGHLSGGQKQAVAICRALRWNAEVIILDEPTAALGVAETGKVLDLITALKDSGKTVILVSHSMLDVEKVADRVTILRAGKVQIELGKPQINADRVAHLVLSGSTELREA